MSRPRIHFHWTRKSYRQAHQLARLLARFMDMPDHAPAILRRYWELWGSYPDNDDPLLTPLRQRTQHYRDEIPF